MWGNIVKLGLSRSDWYSLRLSWYREYSITVNVMEPRQLFNWLTLPMSIITDDWKGWISDEECDNDDSEFGRYPARSTSS